MNLQINKHSNWIILIMFFLSSSFYGCRESAHTRRNKTEQHKKEVTQKNDRTQNHPKMNISENNNGRKIILSGSEIFKKYSKAVFSVVNTNGQSMIQGSGFFIGNDGLAVSNYHVFQGCTIGEEYIKLVGDDTAYKVSEIYQRSEEQDFILFRVNISNTCYIPIAKLKPEIGEKVYAIGTPRGWENTFSSGEISQWRDEYLMQTNALIDHGSSGGALINEYGEVVGITSGTLYEGSQANLNYVWSIDVIKPYIN